MRQYAAIKKEHPDRAAVFPRWAISTSCSSKTPWWPRASCRSRSPRATRRKASPCPCAAFPTTPPKATSAKLIRKGYKVAICDQMEDPRLAKKLVRREVTRVVTPGTAADSSWARRRTTFWPPSRATAGRPRRLCRARSFHRRIPRHRIPRRRRRAPRAGRIATAAPARGAVRLFPAAV